MYNNKDKCKGGQMGGGHTCLSLRDGQRNMTLIEVGKFGSGQKKTDPDAPQTQNFDF